MKTSQMQFEMMVRFMEEHGDLSKPPVNARARVRNIDCWEQLTSLLNSDKLGESKATEKWKKVWSDFKNNTKKKTARIHKTGGRNIKLTDIEQRVLSILAMQVPTTLMNITEAGFGQDTEPDERFKKETSPSDFKAESDTLRASTSPLLSAPIIYDNPVVEYSIQECDVHGQSNQSHISPLSEPSPLPTQPDVSGHTPRISHQHNTSPLYHTFPRRCARSPKERSHLNKMAQHFFRSEPKWRESYIEIERLRNENEKERLRLREMELTIQKDWQVLGHRALDILDKLVNKFCKD